MKKAIIKKTTICKNCKERKATAWVTQKHVCRSCYNKIRNKYPESSNGWLTILESWKKAEKEEEEMQ